MKLGVFSKIFLILLFFVSCFFSINFVYAQDSPFEFFIPERENYVNVSSAQANIKAQRTGNAADIADAEAKAKVAKETKSDDGISQALRHMVGWGAATFLEGGAKILSWFGAVFDMAIKETVIDVGIKFSKDTDKGVYYVLVSEIWKIFRDIANVIVIFSLLYLAIKTILEGNGFADKKILPGILIAATLINFSLFFTKLAFDVSNKIGFAVYSQIVEGPAYGGRSISEGVMSIVNLQGLIKDLESGMSRWEQLTGTLISAMFMVGLMIVLAFIFVSAGVLLLYRFFIFVFLMITSPIGIVSKFIPWMSSAGNMWWDHLKKQVIVLPAFFLAFYVGLYAAGTIFKSIKDGIGTIDVFSPTATASTMGGYLVSFILLVFFLGAALIVPGIVGAKGSEMMTSASKKLQGYGKASLGMMKRAAGTATLGTAAVVGRATVGKLGRMTLDSKSVKGLAQKSGIGGAIARKTLAGADYVGNRATYDGRNIKVGGKAIGEELGLGKGITGYKETFDKKKKEAEAEKERIMKLTGLDKAKSNDPDVIAAKTALDTAMTNRDQLEEDYVTQKGLLDSAISSGNATAATTARAEMQRLQNEKKVANQIFVQMQKDLKSAEEKAEMFAGAKYADISHSRMNRVLNVFRGDIMKNSATKDMVKDMEKSWTKDKSRSRAQALKQQLKNTGYKFRTK